MRNMGAIKVIIALIVIGILLFAMACMVFWSMAVNLHQMEQEDEKYEKESIEKARQFYENEAKAYEIKNNQNTQDNDSKE